MVNNVKLIAHEYLMTQIGRNLTTKNLPPSNPKIFSNTRANIEHFSGKIKKRKFLVIYADVLVFGFVASSGTSYLQKKLYHQLKWRNRKLVLKENKIAQFLTSIAQ